MARHSSGGSSFMYKGIMLFITIVLVTTLVSAQQHSPKSDDFWTAPDAVVKDATGRVVYREIKDPDSFTMRVLRNGEWLTYHYAPHTARITKVETADTEEEHLYSAKGEWDGLKIVAHGLTFTVHGTRDQVSTPGMPALDLIRNNVGRASSWRRAGE